MHGFGTTKSTWCVPSRTGMPADLVHTCTGMGATNTNQGIQAQSNGRRTRMIHGLRLTPLGFVASECS